MQISSISFASTINFCPLDGDLGDREMEGLCYVQHVGIKCPEIRRQELLDKNLRKIILVNDRILRESGTSSLI